MTEIEAIKAIKKNRPTSRYTMLSEALDTAIKALEKQEKIKNILNSNCLSAFDEVCHYDGECKLHRYIEIMKIISADE